MFDEIKKRVKNFFLGLDQWGNTVLGLLFTGFGDPDETISSVVAKKCYEGKRRYCYMCKFFNVLFGQRDHCKRAVEWDEGDNASK